MVRFLERNGYDTSYIAGVDTDRYGSLLTNHKTFLSVGHDEYWSGAQRANVEKARDAGVNLMFLSGNEVYWRTRYEPSIDGANTSYRTLVCYKETWAGFKNDPSPESTGTWRDPRFASTSNGGGLPENRLTGTVYQSNFTDLALQVPAAMGKQRMWRNTTVANQSAGQTATLAPHTVGYESDEDRDNGSRPPGLIRTSQTTGPTDQLLTDFGNTTVKGTTTHSTTLYRASSGALVFGAGTVQWTWGLDSEHDSDGTPPAADPRMQQAQVNLLADMGAQPASLQPDLVAATASTDSTAPPSRSPHPRTVLRWATATRSPSRGRRPTPEVASSPGSRCRRTAPRGIPRRAPRRGPTPTCSTAPGPSRCGSGASTTAPTSVTPSPSHCRRRARAASSDRRHPASPLSRTPARSSWVSASPRRPTGSSTACASTRVRPTRGPTSAPSGRRAVRSWPPSRSPERPRQGGRARCSRPPCPSAPAPPTSFRTPRPRAVTALPRTPSTPPGSTPPR